jgi:hypothetical protein
VEKLMDYLEGVLGLPEREAIDAHVAECLRCGVFLEGYVRTPLIWRTATAAVLSTEGSTALRRFLAARSA